MGCLRRRRLAGRGRSRRVRWSYGRAGEGSADDVGSRLEVFGQGEQNGEGEVEFVLYHQFESRRAFFGLLQRQQFVLVGNEDARQGLLVAGRIFPGRPIDEIEHGRLIEDEQGRESFDAQSGSGRLSQGPGEDAFEVGLASPAKVGVERTTGGLGGQGGLAEGQGERFLCGRDAFVVMDAAGRFVDHVGVGVREQLAQ